MNTMNNTTTFVTESTSSESSFSALKILWIIICSVITIAVIFNNTVVLLSFMFFPKLRRSQNNIPIFNMALTDFLLGIFVLPLGLIFRIKDTWIFGHFFCSFYNGSMASLCHASTFGAFILCLDKYIFFKFPLHYPNLVTPKRMIFVFATTWVASGWLGLFPALPRWSEDITLRGEKLYPLCYMYNSTYVSITVPFTFIPLGLVFYVNHYILRALRKQLKKVRPLPGVNQPIATVDGPGIDGASTLNQGDRNLNLQPGEIKVIKTMLLICITFFILWMPVYTTALASGLCYCVDKIYIEITHWLGFSNSLVNPLLYAYKKEFRYAYGRILRGKFGAESDTANNGGQTSATGVE